MSVCAVCGGKCCKAMPGEVWPDQVGDVNGSKVDAILGLFLTGKYVADCWEGDPRPRDTFEGLEHDEGMFVRPRIKGEDLSEVEFRSWGGECVFLKGDGCELSLGDRPRTCRLLQPKSDDTGKCSFPDLELPSKQSAAIEWMPYHDDILEALKLFEKKVH